MLVKYVPVLTITVSFAEIHRLIGLMSCNVERVFRREPISCLLA